MTRSAPSDFTISRFSVLQTAVTSAPKDLVLFEAELTRYPNVVGLGITSAGGDAAIAVYVSEQPADDEAAPEDRVPASVELPVEGGTTTIAVRVQEIGRAVPEDADASVNEGSDAGAETFTIE